MREYDKRLTMFTEIRFGTPSYNDGEPCVFNFFADSGYEGDDAPDPGYAMSRGLDRRVIDFLELFPQHFLETEFENCKLLVHGKMKTVDEIEKSIKPYDPN